MKNHSENPELFEKYWINLLLLALAIFLINLWINYHINVDGWRLVIINIVPIIYGILTFLISLGPEEEAKSLKKKLRPLLLFFLRPIVLILIYVLFLVSGMLVSSVTVLADGSHEYIKISIIPEGKEESRHLEIIDEPYQIVKFILFSSPFGKSYYIEADGFLRESFELYPWIGRRIRINRDLRPTPTLIFRLPGPNIKIYEGGFFKIVVNNDTIFSQKIKGQKSLSVMLGRYRNITQELKENWKASLTIDDIKEPKRTAFMRAWGNPIILDTITLKHGDSVKIVYLNRSNIVKASINTLVLEDAIQDILLDKF